MCNHYHIDKNDLFAADEAKRWPKRFEVVSEEVYPASPNKVETSYPGTVVVHDGDGWALDAMAWGIVTTLKGAKGQPVKKAVTNVRNLASPFWKGAIASPAQRCLVPFSRFAEPKAGAGREEWWFTVKDRPVAYFAGIWRLSEGIPRFAFLTCEPNPLVAPLHAKAMPVILHETDFDRWMTATYDDAVALAQPYPSQLMEVA